MCVGGCGEDDTLCHGYREGCPGKLTDVVYHWISRSAESE